LTPTEQFFFLYSPERSENGEKQDREEKRRENGLVFFRHFVPLGFGPSSLLEWRRLFFFDPIQGLIR